VNGAIYDHELNGVVSVLGSDVTIAPAMPPTMASVLGVSPPATSSGLVQAVGGDARPILVAYTRSASTQWITTASTSLADLNEPLLRVLKLLSIAGLLMGLLGLGAWRYMRREIESPIEQLERNIASADAAVEQLAERLLQVQEDEHQRIARELHDSTTQHLVGAMLGVAHLERMRPIGDGTRPILNDVKTSVESALNELRTFTFLLHPRDLGESGLVRTLSDFVHGFQRRAALRGTVSIDSAADSLPFELQRSLLRITQAALANVYRHAKATQVDVTLEVSRGHIVLTVADDGLGGQENSSNDENKLGVGIPSMQSRLIPFAGELRISSIVSGTLVQAVVPIPTAN